jgi:hypothetical protein
VIHYFGSLGFSVKSTAFGGVSVRTHAHTPKCGVLPRKFPKSQLGMAEGNINPLRATRVWRSHLDFKKACGAGQGILKVAIVLPPRRQICQVRQDSFGFLGALYKNLASLAVII